MALHLNACSDQETNFGFVFYCSMLRYSVPFSVIKWNFNNYFTYTKELEIQINRIDCDVI